MTWSPATYTERCADIIVFYKVTYMRSHQDIGLVLANA